MLLVAAALASALAASSSAAPTGLREAAAGAGIFFGIALEGRVAERHGALIERDATSITTENALKWATLAPHPWRYDFAEADALVAFGERHGLRVRGHALIWSRLNGMPDWLQQMAASPSIAGKMMPAAMTHIERVVGRYRGRIAQWDVVNEPLAIDSPSLDPKNPFLARFGEAFLVASFQAAAAADPAAELFLNEIFTERNDARFDALLELVVRLRTAGAPIHGIGLQGHFLRTPPDGDGLEARLRRIGALGLKAEITELDIPQKIFAAQPDRAAAQAEAYATVMRACLAVPACSGVTVWGLNDAYSWLGPKAAALLRDADNQPKPAYYATLEALAGGATSEEAEAPAPRSGRDIPSASDR